MRKIRLDVLLVECGLADSRTFAQRLVMAGQVRVDGQLALKPATMVLPGVKLEVDAGPRFVSRGGEKLAAALHTFQIELKGKVCADVGASTGGFTDCLLQNGVERVYVIDVGRGILAWKLRQDKRVVVMEKTNARYLENLPEKIDFVSIDVSFISLKLILPVVKNWLANIDEDHKLEKPINVGQVVALVKPQFEAGRKEVSRGSGVIRDPQIHRQVLEEVLVYAQEAGYDVLGLIPSPLQGPKGNREFLVWLRFPGRGKNEWQALLEALFPNPVDMGD
jgi:23S rRNA (cytidine1920-2'-O)/16S rRNA (cytidine1409-2'-O)-methyltransferase